jgi:hypothetical protein
MGLSARQRVSSGTLFFAHSRALLNTRTLNA